MTITTDLASKFRAARNVSTPLITITTSDPAALVKGLLPQISDTEGKPYPALQWDFVRGLRGVNKLGVETLAAMMAGNASKKLGPVDQDGTVNPDDMLRIVGERAPQSTAIFMLNAQNFWLQPSVSQGIWNLRDPFKSSARTLIMLSPDGTTIPSVLQHDIITFDDPLPGRPELQAIIERLHTLTNLPLPKPERLTLLVDACAGLSAFAAEQIAAMALSKAGMDLEQIRERRREAIKNTPGLSVGNNEATFDTIGGLEQIKKFARIIIESSREPIGAVAFLDEIEKGMAGSGANGQPGDTSGTAQYQHGSVLKGIQDNNGVGMLLFGVPGCGKTEIANAIANELDVELLNVDLGGMQSKYIGESQGNTAAAMKVVNAVGQGRVLWIATCNGLSGLSTELRSRLRTYGEWFFDLPDEIERAAIVKIYCEKWNLTVSADNPLPDMSGWVGREIRAMMFLAYNLQLKFRAAAEFIVPMIVSDKSTVDRIRAEAIGRFRSASKPGYYKGPDDEQAETKQVERVMQLDDIPDEALRAVALAGTKNKRAN